MTHLAPFTSVFLGLCLSSPAFAGEPKPPPRATPPQVQQTVERSLKYLQGESSSWLATRKCAACHHVPMPLWALGEAGRQGYPVDMKFVTDTFEATLGSREKMIAARLIAGPNDPPDPRPLAKGVITGAVFLAAAAKTMPAVPAGQKESVKWIVGDTLKKQRDDGSWEFFLCRPPINESEAGDTVWILLALEGEAGTDAALKKATAWLAGVKPSESVQDKAFKVLLAVRAGKSPAEVQPAVDDLLASQRKDGGWGQLPSLQSDAFATGQALYVLSLAGYTAERPAVQRAVDFLVATQKPDGSWPMLSRSSPDGKPGGSAKYLPPITTAAGSWATLGLARLVPKRP
jgi:hypothetical protein